MIVPNVPRDLFSRSRREIAAWVLTNAEYACVDFHDAERRGEFVNGVATETTMLLQMVLVRIGLRPAEIPINFNSPIWDLMVIRGHIRGAFDWKCGPKHRNHFSY